MIKKINYISFYHFISVKIQKSNKNLCILFSKTYFQEIKKIRNNFGPFTHIF